MMGVAYVPDKQMTRDEPRIRHNLDRYHEAAETWRVYSHRARQAKATMDDALACLRAAGGTAEAERLTDA
jgi:hypothetical protein